MRSSLLQEQDVSGAGASTGLSAAEAQEEAAIAALNQELFQENRKSAPEFWISVRSPGRAFLDEDLN